jgi:hypothetical protein
MGKDHGILGMAGVMALHVEGWVEGTVGHGNAKE